MEPTKSPLKIVYRWTTHIESVEEFDGVWSVRIKGIPARFHVGPNKPDLDPGDPTQLTIEKAPANALPR